MWKLKQYIWIIVAAMLWGHLGYAQNKRDTIQGEIWMTEAELEAFLTRIAARKKQQLEKRKSPLQIYGADTLRLSRLADQVDQRLLDELRLMNERIDFLCQNNSPIIDQQGQVYTGSAIASSQQYKEIGQQNDSRVLTVVPENQIAQEEAIDYYSDRSSMEVEALQNQIEALNKEIAVLSSQLQSNIRQPEGAYEAQVRLVQRGIDELNQTLQRQHYRVPVKQQVVAGSVASLPIQPVIVYQSTQSPTEEYSESPVQDIARPQELLRDTLLAQHFQASTLLNFQLQQQIDSLYQKLQVYDDSTGYRIGAEGLSSKINRLSAEVAQMKKENNKLSDSIENTPAQEEENLLKNYQHSIYFANNSSDLLDKDLIVLNDLGHKIHESVFRATVVLRGFSSSIGRPEYNEQLSRKRAEAVKRVLLQFGLDPKDIVTLYHGADPSKSEDLARRVEVTLSVY